MLPGATPAVSKIWWGRHGNFYAPPKASLSLHSASCETSKHGSPRRSSTPPAVAPSSGRIKHTDTLVLRWCAFNQVPGLGPYGSAVLGKSIMFAAGGVACDDAAPLKVTSGAVNVLRKLYPGAKANDVALVILCSQMAGRFDCEGAISQCEGLCAEFRRSLEVLERALLSSGDGHWTPYVGVCAKLTARRC